MRLIEQQYRIGVNAMPGRYDIIRNSLDLSRHERGRTFLIIPVVLIAHVRDGFPELDSVIEKHQAAIGTWRNESDAPRVLPGIFDKAFPGCGEMIRKELRLGEARHLFLCAHL
jgi:hypothetical protein